MITLCQHTFIITGSSYLTPYNTPPFKGNVFEKLSWFGKGTPFGASQALALVHSSFATLLHMASKLLGLHGDSLPYYTNRSIVCRWYM